MEINIEDFKEFNPKNKTGNFLNFEFKCGDAIVDVDNKYQNAYILTIIPKQNYIEQLSIIFDNNNYKSPMYLKQTKELLYILKQQ